MHSQFETLLKAMTPTDEVIEIATNIFREIWEKRSAGSAERTASVRREIGSTEKSIGLLIDRIANASNPELVQVYESRLVDLQRQKIALSEKFQNSAQNLPDFDSTLRTALEFLASPYNLWETGNVEDRRAVRKLVFTEHLEYAPELGFPRRNNVAIQDLRRPSD